MAHLEDHAAQSPDRAAVITSTGRSLTFAELMARSNRLANVFHDAGLRRGDVVNLLLPNCLEFLEVCWAAQRSGLYFAPINTHLYAEEVRFVLEDAGAGAVVTGVGLADLTAGFDDRGTRLKLVVGGEAPGYARYEDELAKASEGPPPERSEGSELNYSSGTTGRPKAVKRPLPGPEGSYGQLSTAGMLGEQYGLGAGGVFLTPSPLYHAAGIVWSMGAHRLGATVVLMANFDAEDALRLIERHRVTHGHFVPTMFIRMLKLPDDVRSRYDVSSMQCAIHAAAPCPVPVKRQMLEWWGPKIYEYYGGTEALGGSLIGPEEWLGHPGSVGKPFSPTHILDDAGNELPAGQSGVIHFEGGPEFEYHNDPGKVAQITSRQGWRTYGDMGYLDEDGYLYLTDRATFMIVSGGVNIYPQEIENLLIVHPKVTDAAVFGIPNAEFGEEVKAVVQPAAPSEAGPALESELMAYCREHLAHYKCPRSVDFTDALPRDPNGKLYKRLLRDPYWTGRDSKIV